ncbi:RND3 protein, partial [Polyodon spathula]|nr:RND3 protein [Polyodon spathula]
MKERRQSQKLFNTSGMDPNQSVKCKIVVVGDSQCGKTALLHVFAKDCFPENYVPTVFENYTASFEIDTQRIELSLWDTSVLDGTINPTWFLILAAIFCAYPFLVNRDGGNTCHFVSGLLCPAFVSGISSSTSCITPTVLRRMRQRDGKLLFLHCCEFIFKHKEGKPLLFQLPNSQRPSTSKTKFHRFLTVSIWSPYYDNVRPLSYPDSDAVLICFDISRPETLDSVLKKWKGEIQEFCPNTKMLLVGCKSDLRTALSTLVELSNHRQTPVSYDQGSNMAKQIGAPYIECSSLQSENSVRDIFHVATLACVNKTNKNVKRNKSTRATKRISHMPSRPDLSAVTSELRKDKAKSCTVM